MENSINISVIGAGRFGSFFGKEFNRFFDVIYFDRTKKDAGYNYEELDECLKREIIFLALPISEIEKFLIANSNKISPDSILVDLSSVKLKPAWYFNQYLPPSNQYLMTHPLFGPDSAKLSIAGEKIVITESRISSENELLIRGIFKDKLKLVLIDLSADEHDRLMAYNLSLMHHLGRAFNEMDIPGLKLKMKSIEDLSRITRFVMNDSEQLFKDFYLYNPYAHKIRLHFEESFRKISSLL